MTMTAEVIRLAFATMAGPSWGDHRQECPVVCDFFAARTARIRDRFLREIAQLWTDHHHAEGRRCPRATSANALDVLLLLRRQFVVFVWRRDAIAAKS